MIGDAVVEGIKRVRTARRRTRKGGDIVVLVTSMVIVRRTRRDRVVVLERGSL